METLMLANPLGRIGEYVTYSESSGSADIIIPSSAKAGDIGIFIDTAYGSVVSTPSAVIPSGWTEFIDNAAVNHRRFTWVWKILTASDAGATVTGMSNSNTNKVLLVFRIRNGKGAPSIVNAVSQLAGSSDPSPQTVYSSNYGYGSIVGAYIWGSGGNPEYSSGTFDATNLNTIIYINTAYKRNNITRNNNTIDCPNGGGNATALSSWLIIDQ